MATPEFLDVFSRGESPYGVTASFLGECAPTDLDGACWEVEIADEGCAGTVEVELSGSDGGRDGMNVPPEKIEAATQRLALHFPVKARAACMIGWSEHIGPLSLHRGDL